MMNAGRQTRILGYLAEVMFKTSAVKTGKAAFRIKVCGVSRESKKTGGRRRDSSWVRANFRRDTPKGKVAFTIQASHHVRASRLCTKVSHQAY